MYRVRSSKWKHTSYAIMAKTYDIDRHVCVVLFNGMYACMYVCCGNAVKGLLLGFLGVLDQPLKRDVWIEMSERVSNGIV